MVRLRKSATFWKFRSPTRAIGALLETPEYYALREYLITFLEERAHLRPSQMEATGGKILDIPGSDATSRLNSSAG